MPYKDLTIPVGRRALEDTQKVGIPARLITPETRSEILLVFSTGLFGNHPDYSKYFGELLGEEFNVCLAELRRKGFARGETLRRDFFEIDHRARDMAETNKVVYVGHSMGAAIANRTAEEHGTQPLGIYGVNAYPSLGGAFSKVDFGPLMSFYGKQSKIPTRVALGGKDNLLRTHNPQGLQNVTNIFSSNGAEVMVLPNGNHCCNHKTYDYAPFNKDAPQKLVEDIRQFVLRVVG